MLGSADVTTSKMTFGRVRRNGNLQRVRRRRIQKQEEESAEIKAYLTKLQDIVPLMPKNRRLKKVEVISYVIEYIRNLRQTLGLPPSFVNEDDVEMMDPESAMISALTNVGSNSTAAVATVTVIDNSSQIQKTASLMTSPESVSHNLQSRQPLAAISNPIQQATSS